MTDSTRHAWWIGLLILSIAIPIGVTFEYLNGVVDSWETTFYIFATPMFSGLFTFEFIDSIENYYFKTEDYENFLNDTP